MDRKGLHGVVGRRVYREREHGSRLGFLMRRRRKGIRVLRLGIRILRLGISGLNDIGMSV